MKKLIDLLFEPEEEEGKVVVEAPLEEVKPLAEPVKQPVQEARPAPVKTEEKKTEKKRSGSFIDLDELQVRKPAPKKEKEAEKKEEVRPYESQPAISPIFGYVDKEKTGEPVLHTPQIKKDSGSVLGTVYSPFYGVIPQKEEEPVRPEPKRPQTPAVDVLPKEETIQGVTQHFSAGEMPLQGIREDGFENHSLDEILHDDETYVAAQEISLFDELFKDDKE
ncbi:MAG: hypothetical protein IKE21_06680 [Erysipelotrichaceae bacterium]|nr:hypothetical protein [Erysipelotrichaceae bacterium]